MNLDADARLVQHMRFVGQMPLAAKLITHYQQYTARM
jgi:hypothetical protein